MGNFARAFSILALILISIPVVFQALGGLLFVGGILGFLGFVLGFLSRNDPDQATAGKVGLISGLVAVTTALFLVMWLSTSQVVVESPTEISVAS